MLLLLITFFNSSSLSTVIIPARALQRLTGSTNKPASPATSGKEEMLEVITGQPPPWLRARTNQILRRVTDKRRRLPVRKALLSLRRCSRRTRLSLFSYSVPGCLSMSTGTEDRRCARDPRSAILLAHNHFRIQVQTPLASEDDSCGRDVRDHQYLFAAKVCPRRLGR